MLNPWWKCLYCDKPPFDSHNYKPNYCTCCLITVPSRNSCILTWQFINIQIICPMEQTYMIISSVPIFYFKNCLASKIFYKSFTTRSPFYLKLNYRGLKILVAKYFYTLFSTVLAIKLYIFVIKHQGSDDLKAKVPTRFHIM